MHTNTRKRGREEESERETGIPPFCSTIQLVLVSFCYFLAVVRGSIIYSGVQQAIVHYRFRQTTDEEGSDMGHVHY